IYLLSFPTRRSSDLVSITLFELCQEGMKRSWNFSYAGLLAALAIVVVWLLVSGHEGQGDAVLALDSKEILPGFFHPLAILVLQIISVILVARGVSYLTDMWRQPSVVGEIVAGIMLGPSLLGMIAPSISAFVFPEASLDNLQLLSQFGLILFMFTIGMELDVKRLKNKARAAVIVS